MNKRYLHHLWTKVRTIKPWYFLVLAILSSLVCVFALRANNQHMLRLREAVYTADKDNTDVAGALKSLQSYVTAHMNTNLNSGPNAVYPPIQLQHTYDRLVQAQIGQKTGDQLYNEAQQYCEQQDSTDFSGRNRTPCVGQYVQSHGSGQQPATNIPDALYKFSFVSPSWSPDLAGWSMVLAVLAWLLFAFRLGIGFLLKKLSS